MFKKLGLFLAAALMLAGGAYASETPNSIITPQHVKRGIAQFLQGTDTAGTYKTLYTAGVDGSIIKGIFATSNDPTLAHAVTCQIVNSTVKYGGSTVNVPVNSGFATAVPAVNLMSAANWAGLPVDNDGNPFFILVSGDTLQCTFATALTTSDLINVVAVALDL